MNRPRYRDEKAPRKSGPPRWLLITIVVLVTMSLLITMLPTTPTVL